MVIIQCHLVFAILSLFLANHVVSSPAPIMVSSPNFEDITLSSLHLLNASIPVDPTHNPDWTGDMTVADCSRAAGYFRGRIYMYDPDDKITFWTARSTTRPAGEEFELPFGVRYKSCTLLLRMTKDYGDNILPTTRGRFYNATADLSKATLTWNNVMDEFDGMLARMEFEGQVRPVWTTCSGVTGYNAVVMFIPSKSVVAKTWAADMRSGTVLDTFRGTTLFVG